MLLPRLFLALLIGASLSFSSCCCKKKTTDTTTTTSSAVRITANDNAKTFHVKLNSTVDAAFTECVGCAQVWQVTAMDKDQLESLPNTYSDRSCTNCTGGNQTNTFHFKAKATGTSTLSFSYFEQKVSVTIIIE